MVYYAFVFKSFYYDYNLSICKNYVDDKFINFENNKVINVKHKHTSLQKCE